MRTIYIVNGSKHVTTSELNAAVGALSIQVHRDFMPRWSAGCALVATSSAGPGQEAIHLQDNLTVPNALGYHDVAGPDTPIGFVDVALTLQVGDRWQATLSHELLEQLVDPFCQGGYIGMWNGRTALLAAETCDPTEMGEYLINGVAVSNFITPYWFVQPPLHAGAQTDFLNVLHGKPMVLDHGGYVAYTHDLNNWNQAFGSHVPAHQKAVPEAWSRRGRRFKKLAGGYKCD